MEETNYMCRFSEILGNKQNMGENIENHVELLVELWTVFSMPLPESTASVNMLRVENGFKHLFKETTQLILSHGWSEVSNESRQLLAKVLLKSGEVLDSQIAKTKSLCESLSKVTTDPWGEAYLKSINPDDINNAAEQFFISEPLEMTLVRIEILYNDKKENDTLRLCECYIKSKESEFKDHEVINGQVDGEDMDEKISLSIEEENAYRDLFPIFVWLIRLLNRKKELKTIVERTSCLKCHDGVRLIRVFLDEETDESNQLALILSEIFIMRDLLYSKIFCCTKELMELWCLLQVIMKKPLKQVALHARKMVVIYASSSAHFYLFVDVLWEKFGVKLTKLYVELYIRGLTSDLNHLEATRVSAPISIVKELETHIAYVYNKLSQLFRDNASIARECVLSAFALRPTRERLDLLLQTCPLVKKRIDLSIDNNKNVESPPRETNFEVIDITDTDGGVSIVPAHSAMSLQVSGPVLFGEESSFKPCARNMTDDSLIKTKFNFDVALKREMNKNGLNLTTNCESTRTSDSSRTEFNAPISRKCNCEGRCSTPDGELDYQSYPFIHPILNTEVKSVSNQVLQDLVTVLEGTRCIKWRCFTEWDTFPDIGEEYLREFTGNNLIRKLPSLDSDGSCSATEYEEQAIPQPSSASIRLVSKPLLNSAKVVRRDSSDSDTEEDLDSDSFDSDSNSDDLDVTNSDETWDHKQRKKKKANHKERSKMIRHLMNTNRKKKHRKENKGDKERELDRRNKRKRKKVKKKGRNESSDAEGAAVKPQARQRQKSVDINNSAELENIVGSNHPRILLSRLEDKNSSKKALNKNKSNKLAVDKNSALKPKPSSSLKESIRNKLLLKKKSIMTPDGQAANSSQSLLKKITEKSLLRKKAKDKILSGKEHLKKVLNNKKLEKDLKEAAKLMDKKKKKKKLCTIQTQTDFVTPETKMVKPGLSYLAPPPSSILVKSSPKNEEEEIVLTRVVNVENYYLSNGLPNINKASVLTSTTWTMTQSFAPSSKPVVLKTIFSPRIITSTSKKELPTTATTKPSISTAIKLSNPKIIKSPKSLLQNKLHKKADAVKSLSNPRNLPLPPLNVVDNVAVPNSTTVNVSFANTNVDAPIGSSPLIFSLKKMINGQVMAVPIKKSMQSNSNLTPTTEQVIRLPIMSMGNKVVAKINTFKFAPQQRVVRPTLSSSVIIPQALPMARMPLLVVPQEANKQPNVLSTPQTVIHQQHRTERPKVASPRVKKMWKSVRSKPGYYEYRKVDMDVDNADNDIDHGLLARVREMKAREIVHPATHSQKMVTTLRYPEPNVALRSAPLNLTQPIEQSHVPISQPSRSFTNEYVPSKATESLLTDNNILAKAMEAAEVPKTVIDSKDIQEMSYPIEYLQQFEDTDCAQADPESRADTATLYAAAPQETSGQELNVLTDAAMSPNSVLTQSVSPNSLLKRKRKKSKDGEEDPTQPKKKKTDQSPLSPGNVCQLCQKCMASSYNLRRHMKTVHRVEISSPKGERRIEKAGGQHSFIESTISTPLNLSKSYAEDSMDVYSSVLIAPKPEPIINVVHPLNSILTLSNQPKIGPGLLGTEMPNIVFTPTSTTSILRFDQNPLPPVPKENLVFQPSLTTVKVKKPYVRKKKPPPEVVQTLDQADKRAMIEEIIAARLGKKNFKQNLSPRTKKPDSKKSEKAKTPNRKNDKGNIIGGSVEKKPKKAKPKPVSSSSFDVAHFNQLLLEDPVLRDLQSRFTMDETNEDIHNMVQITLNEIINKVVDRLFKDNLWSDKFMQPVYEAVRMSVVDGLNLTKSPSRLLSKDEINRETTTNEESLSVPFNQTNNNFKTEDRVSTKPGGSIRVDISQQQKPNRNVPNFQCSPHGAKNIFLALKEAHEKTLFNQQANNSNIKPLTPVRKISTTIRNIKSATQNRRVSDPSSSSSSCKETLYRTYTETTTNFSSPLDDMTIIRGMLNDEIEVGGIVERMVSVVAANFKRGGRSTKSNKRSPRQLKSEKKDEFVPKSITTSYQASFEKSISNHLASAVKKQHDRSSKITSDFEILKKKKPRISSNLDLASKSNVIPTKVVSGQTVAEPDFSGIRDTILSMINSIVQKNTMVALNHVEKDKIQSVDADSGNDGMVLESNESVPGNRLMEIHIDMSGEPKSSESLDKSKSFPVEPVLNSTNLEVVPIDVGMVTNETDNGSNEIEETSVTKTEVYFAETNPITIETDPPKTDSIPIEIDTVPTETDVEVKTDAVPIETDVELKTDAVPIETDVEVKTDAVAIGTNTVAEVKPGALLMETETDLEVKTDVVLMETDVDPIETHADPTITDAELKPDAAPTISDAELKPDAAPTEADLVPTETDAELKTYAVPTETDAITCEADTVPIEIHTVPTETDAVPTETDAVPTETVAVLIEIHTVPTETDAVPIETNPVPIETDPVPIETDPVPIETDPVPIETHTGPIETHTVLTENNFVPIETHTVPTENDFVPIETHTVPTETDAELKNDAVPTETNATLIENVIVPIGTDAVPTESDAASDKTVAVPTKSNVVRNEDAAIEREVFFSKPDVGSIVTETVKTESKIVASTKLKRDVSIVTTETLAETGSGLNRTQILTETQAILDIETKIVKTTSVSDPTDVTALKDEGFAKTIESVTATGKKDEVDLVKRTPVKRETSQELKPETSQERKLETCQELNPETKKRKVSETETLVVINTLMTPLSPDPEIKLIKEVEIIDLTPEKPTTEFVKSITRVKASTSDIEVVCKASGQPRTLNLDVDDVPPSDAIAEPSSFVLEDNGDLITRSNSYCTRKTKLPIWEIFKDKDKPDHGDQSENSDVDLVMEVDCCENEVVVSDECKTPEECVSEDCEYLGTTKADSSASSQDSVQEITDLHCHEKVPLTLGGRRRKREVKSHPKRFCPCCETGNQTPKKTRKNSGNSSGGRSSPTTQVLRRTKSTRGQITKKKPSRSRATLKSPSKNETLMLTKNEGIRILRSRTRSTT